MNASEAQYYIKFYSLPATCGLMELHSASHSKAKVIPALNALFNMDTAYVDQPNPVMKTSGMFVFNAPVDGNHYYRKSIEFYEYLVSVLKDRFDLLFESDVLRNIKAERTHTGGPFKMYVFKVRGFEEWFAKYVVQQSQKVEAILEDEEEDDDSDEYDDEDY